jgi:predicted dehydrogenase/threonine dehydrogenase-like Zn-dependent dehydrogenase
LKQFLQSLKDGSSAVVEVPAPIASGASVVVQSRASLLSSGTERMLVDFGRSNLLGKAIKYPDRVREVVAKVRSQGLLPTYRAIRDKLSWPMPLGYCHVGVVLDPGPKSEFFKGERVVSNSFHAEIVMPPSWLCAKIPDSVTDADATFTPLAAIALNGIKMLGASCGEKVAVVGLGLIGQIAVRILLARGCQVLGLDPDAARRSMAERAGAYVPKEEMDPVRAAMSWTSGDGAAGVLITASSSSHAIVSQAVRSCRRRGRVVLVGVVGLNLNRADFYANEATFQVSQSYGDKTHAGPGSVRENFSEVLQLMSDGSLKVEDLVTHRYDFMNAKRAYDQLSNPAALGILLHYGSNPSPDTAVRLCSSAPGTRKLAIIGAGNYSTRTLLPALREVKSNLQLKIVVSHQGYQAYLAAERFGAEVASTSESDALCDPDVAGVIIATRHDNHARLAIEAISHGKYVWVEKPLALKLDELTLIEEAAAKGLLMVGFNRRFAPAATILREATAHMSGSRSFSAVINAGLLERTHWALDPVKGGGRIVGEACHFVDLARYLVGEPILSVSCTRRDVDGQDGGCFVLTFPNGSIGTIDYRTDMPEYAPKETVNLSSKDWCASIENWTNLTTRGLGGVGWSSKLKGSQKGQLQALEVYLKSIEEGSMPVSLAETIEVSKVAIVLQNLRAGETVEISKKI